MKNIRLPFLSPRAALRARLQACGLLCTLAPTLRMGTRTWPYCVLPKHNMTAFSSWHGHLAVVPDGTEHSLAPTLWERIGGKLLLPVEHRRPIRGWRRASDHAWADAAGRPSGRLRRAAFHAPDDAPRLGSARGTLPWGGRLSSLRPAAPIRYSFFSPPLGLFISGARRVGTSMLSPRSKGPRGNVPLGRSAAPRRRPSVATGVPISTVTRFLLIIPDRPGPWRTIRSVEPDDSKQPTNNSNI